MKHLEKVEKLREKADITYEEARAVLEECEWDLLDAVIKLESQGKMSSKGTADFSTEGSGEHESKSPLQLAESYQNYQEHNHKKEKSTFQSICSGLQILLRKSMDNKFIVKHHGSLILEIPVLMLILLMLAFFWLLLILMPAGLFFGFSYSFAGPELGRDDINNAMNRATEAAENLKEEVICRKKS